MARIVWTREALGNLDLIRAYIHQFDPGAARNLAGRLIEASASLRDFPERGRSVTGGKRELVSVRPYVIRYRVEGDSVYILRIRHAAQDER
jgi:toxin ParE1/3/4